MLNLYVDNTLTLRKLYRIYLGNQFQYIQVTSLEAGKIYAGGTINDFQRLTGWMGGNVMYFGDHPYADLADVTLHHGWKTAAVIR